MTIDFTTLIDEPQASSAADWPLLIDGAWQPSESGDWINVSAPSRGADFRLARVPSGTSADIDLAVSAAQRALPKWSHQSFTERAGALLAIADDLERESEYLARLTAQDTGNAIRTQARPEVATLISLFRYFAGVAGEYKGVVLPPDGRSLQYTLLEPIGVVGAILPWNSPLMIAGMKLPAALAAGNTLVVKPANDAPLTILALAAIMSRHLPDGVINVVTGTGSTVGNAIVNHPGVGKVSFTGSTEIGRTVGQHVAGRLGKFSLELGGKSPSIVFPSAVTEDVVDKTVDGVLKSMRFTRQGQSCTAGSRLFVHQSVYDTFLDRLAHAAGQLVVGDPLLDETDMGAIINRGQHEKILSYIDEAESVCGARAVLDGRDIKEPEVQGCYQGPTILGGVDNHWRVAREEIFGPVLVAIPWADTDEAVAMANDTHYGLAAYIWSQNLTEALQTAGRVDSGWIQINQGGGQLVGQSYGGYKASGSGREFSLEGAIDAFTQTKQINVAFE